MEPEQKEKTRMKPIQRERGIEFKIVSRETEDEIETQGEISEEEVKLNHFQYSLWVND